MPTQPAAVLFDLDGTLADTAQDLAYALNQTLAQYGVDPLPFRVIRPVVSHGAMALIQLGFHLNQDEEGFNERRHFLLQIYAANLCRRTRLFDGMAEVLARLEHDQIPWGVVTNKPASLTDPLMQQLALSQRTQAIVSGDTCRQRKPHPMPVQHACRLLGVDPRQTWCVGDAGRDIEAGRAAGNLTIGALWGYIHPSDPAARWGADHYIEHPRQLIRLLDEAHGHA